MLAHGVAVVGVLALTTGGLMPTTNNVAQPSESCVERSIRSGAEAWVCVDESAGTLLPGRVGKPTPLKDEWCAYGKSCQGHYGPYIHWHKTPAAYGDDNDVIGTFDVVQKVTLKSRTPWYTITLIHKGHGDPAVSFFDSVVRCSEDDFFADKNCGEHYIPDRQIAPGRRIVADEERGNKLHNADTYFSVYYTKFKAAGHSRTWTTQGLKSKEWYCPKGNKRCYFPGQK